MIGDLNKWEGGWKISCKLIIREVGINEWGLKRRVLKKIIMNNVDLSE